MHRSYTGGKVGREVYDRIRSYGTEREAAHEVFLCVIGFCFFVLCVIPLEDVALGKILFVKAKYLRIPLQPCSPLYKYSFSHRFTFLRN